MPKTLKVLSRISNWHIDQLRRKLRVLKEELNDLTLSLKNLEVEQIEEQKVTENQPIEGGLTFGAYIKATEIKKAELFDRMRETNETIDLVREELRLIYVEAKKFEIAQTNRDNDVKRASDLLEQANLDEVGILGYIKK